MGRLLALVLGLMAISLVPFAIWGQGLEAALPPGAAADWMRGFGAWAWAAGLALIGSDILLPVPATAVMAALGIVYGPWIGGALAGLGSFLAGMAGYGICRALGPDVARRLAGTEGLAQAETLFARWGGWLVAGSRWLPVLPETVAFLAGLARMRPARFALALACGALPLGMTFAALGHFGADRPLATMLAAALAPLALWAVIGRALRRGG